MSSVRGFDFSGERLREFPVPDFFKKYWLPDSNSLKFWEWNLSEARAGRPYKLPDDTMRMPQAELHQLMAKEFWEYIPKDFSSILDVGCSDGYMVNIFQRTGKKAMGINDFLYPTDQIYIEENNLNLREMDMHCLDFKNESFDAVWCRHTLEHSFAPIQALAEIYRVLKPGGYLFACLPPVPGVPEHYEGHWHQIPEYQFRYLLELCHFTIDELCTVDFSHKSQNDNSEIRVICRKTIG